MSTEPDRDFPELDRPLTVPLLVRGALDARVILGMMFLSFILAAIALNTRVRHPWDRVAPWLWILLALAVAVPAVLMAMWHVPRRRWLEVTVTGFVLTERGKRLACSDDAVVGLTRSFTLDSGKVVHHRIVLEIKREGDPIRIDCSYSVQPGLADPLAAFWDRLIAGIARRLRANLSRGVTLVGERWYLNERALHHRQGSVSLDHITKVGYYNRKLCLWKDDDERAFLRLPADGRNVQPLGAFLWEQRPASPGLPGKPLGRVLIDLRSYDWIMGIFVLFVGTPITFFLSRALLAHPSRLYLGVVVAMGLTTLLCSVAAYTFRRGSTGRLVFHERGVSQPSREGTRMLLHEEIGTVLWQAGPTLTFIPHPDLDRPTIIYRTGVSLAEDLTPMRDLVCARLAERWAKDLQAGPVQWTPRLRFLPGALEYRPGGLLGDGEPVAVSYSLTSFQLDGATFRLFVTGQPRAVCKERTDLPNFFVGLVLLQMIYRSYRNPSASPPAAKLGGDQRITLPGPTRGRITPDLT